MTEKEFGEYTRKNLKKLLPPGFEDARIVVEEFEDPSYGRDMSLSVFMPGRDLNPRVALGQFFVDGRMVSDPDSILLMIAEGLTRFRPPAGLPATLDFSDYESAREKLSTRLFDAEVSRSYLKDKVWKKVGEFALVYRIAFKSESGLNGVPITPEMLDSWNIDEKQLFQDTMEMEEKQRPPVLCLSSGGMRGPNILEHPEKFRLSQWEPYILTHKDLLNGATVIARPGLLARIADLFRCSFWVLPTSIHEVMLAPDTGRRNASDLEQAVYDGNRNRLVVDTAEVLSDKVHYFNRKTGELKYIHQ